MHFFRTSSYRPMFFLSNDLENPGSEKMHQHSWWLSLNGHFQCQNLQLHSNLYVWILDLFQITNFMAKMGKISFWSAHLIVSLLLFDQSLIVLTSLWVLPKIDLSNFVRFIFFFFFVRIFCDVFPAAGRLYLLLAGPRVHLSQGGR